MLGADISWPQCPPGMGIEYKESSGQPMPTAEAEYVVIGLTNGPGFHANPCLADQVAYARERRLLVAAYSVISWPDEAAQAAVRRAAGGRRRAGAVQHRLDEGRRAGLADRLARRRAGAVLRVVEQHRRRTPRWCWARPRATSRPATGSGVYSTPYIWASLVGDLSLGVPEWRAAGQTSRAEAEEPLRQPTGRSRAARRAGPVGRGRPGQERHLPGGREGAGDYFAAAFHRVLGETGPARRNSVGQRHRYPMKCLRDAHCRAYP